MKIKKTVCVTAVSALFALFSAIGNATVITSSGNNPLSFTWLYSSVAGNLTGNGSLTISGFNTNTLIVDVILNNTSGLSTNRLTAFGFGIDPNATSVSFSDASDGGMISAVLDNIPSLATIEVCAYGGQNCPGGANGGILGGLSDSFRISLLNETITTTKIKGVTTTTRTLNPWGNSVDIAPIGFKYQTGSGSFEFTTSSSSSSSNGGLTSSGTSIPEPGMLALLSAGLLGQALLIRQRRRRQK
ncbi:MAG: PEP-CTERM protein-sorting domain-containing protein [Candidatus Nitrotoga sp. MKT]|nr:MAG: PEP-CTERM protein-sorting domain-containing protein [Candidatus Nitrotoga sp. MKT]